MHRQDQRRDGRMLNSNILYQFQPGCGVQRDINDDQIRRLRRDTRQRLRGVFRLAADNEVFLLVDQVRQPLPHQRMIVHQEDPASRLVPLLEIATLTILQSLSLLCRPVAIDRSRVFRPRDDC